MNAQIDDDLYPTGYDSVKCKAQNDDESYTPLENYLWRKRASLSAEVNSLKLERHNSAILQNALKLAMLVNRQKMLDELSADFSVHFCKEYSVALIQKLTEFIKNWKQDNEGN